MSITKGALKQLRLLQQKKHRDAQGLYLAEGFTIAAEALAGKERVVALYISGSHAQEPVAQQLMRDASARRVPVTVIKEKEYVQISTMTTPPGCLAVIEQREPASLRMDEPILVLDALQDPGNVGTIIRTADWYGVRQVVLGKRCVDIYNPKVIQAAMGSLFRVACHEEADLIEIVTTLQQKQYTVIALALSGSTKRPDFTSRTALVVGSESHGVSQQVLDHADRVYTLDGVAGAESLNAAVATGIALSQLYDSIG